MTEPFRFEPEEPPGFTPELLAALARLLIHKARKIEAGADGEDAIRSLPEKVKFAESLDEVARSD
jgi:hypothetical protein